MYVRMTTDAFPVMAKNVDVDLFSKVFQTLQVDGPTERHAFISVSVTYRRVSGHGKKR